MKALHHKHPEAKKLVGISLVISGILVFVSGLNVSNPFAGEISRIVTATPDGALWLSLAGMVAMLTGLMLVSDRTH